MTQPTKREGSDTGETTAMSLAALGSAMAASGFFPDIKNEAQAVVKILAGRELGFGPVYSMMKVFIITTQRGASVAIAAEAMGAKIKQSGQYNYRIKEWNNDKCVLDFTDNGALVFESQFTMEDAERAGLIRDGGNWKKWPRPMLFSKALSQGARAVCPHVIAGAYTPEDFGYSQSDEGGLALETVEDSTLRGDTIQDRETEGANLTTIVETPTAPVEPTWSTMTPPVTTAQERELTALAKTLGIGTWQRWATDRGFILPLTTTTATDVIAKLKALLPARPQR